MRPDLGGGIPPHPVGPGAFASTLVCVAGVAAGWVRSDPAGAASTLVWQQGVADAQQSLGQLGPSPGTDTCFVDYFNNLE